MSKKYVDQSWDFKADNTKEYTHCYHSYPAMMIPQVARRILNHYGRNAKKLFDPFCGTGTSLVEANLQNIEASGTDLNPLARLIAQTKTNLINLQVLDLYLKDFHDSLFPHRFNTKKTKSIVLPNFSNIDYWFSKDVQKELVIIKSFIDNISDSSVKDFFKVSFSETVRECSWTRNNEFKLYRMAPSKIEKFQPDVFAVMEKKLSRNKKGLISFINAKKNTSQSKVFDFNTVNGIPENLFSIESIDIVVTSPPYGDSRTTVAYGQFSRLANQWLGYTDAPAVDKKLMGGIKANDDKSFSSKALNEALEKVNNKDSERVKDVYSFFNDYEKSINNVSSIIRRGGYACYVIGNRTVKGINILTDEITKDFFESNGFEHIETIVRNIPNKKMPLENSPSNIAGEKSSTMRNEFIVIMQKN